ncbi:hypothetical protein MKW98_012043, partial [Papaver atlanticum]
TRSFKNCCKPVFVYHWFAIYIFHKSKCYRQPTSSGHIYTGMFYEARKTLSHKTRDLQVYWDSNLCWRSDYSFNSQRPDYPNKLGIIYYLVQERLTSRGKQLGTSVRELQLHFSSHMVHTIG